MSVVRRLRPDCGPGKRRHVFRGLDRCTQCGKTRAEAEVKPAPLRDKIARQIERQKVTPKERKPPTRKRNDLQSRYYVLPPEYHELLSRYGLRRLMAEQEPNIRRALRLKEEEARAEEVVV